ncbi:MAG: hypothetical protein ACOH17_06875 [Cellulomonas sp.]
MKGVRSFTATFVGMCLLAGCASSAPDISATTSNELQATVQEIGAAAAAGHHTAAVTLLDTLQSRLDHALAAGRVSGDRGVQIQSAIDQVRDDLGALVAAPAPVPTQSTSPAASDTATPVSTKDPAGPKKDKGKGKG